MDGRKREKDDITMRRLHDAKGMTLLEVTIALFVLAIGLLGLAGLQLVALRGDTLGHEATLATTLAKNKMAELQETDQLFDGTDQYIDKSSGVTYTREWTLEVDSPQEDLKTVKVQVSWRGVQVDRCVTVSTIIEET
jgi:type IV pilus assembly protein PilV